MKSVLLAVVVLASVLAAERVDPPAPWAEGTVLAVSRYDQLRDGIATAIGDIAEPTVLWTFQTAGTIATSPLAADVDGDGAMEIFFGEFMPTDAADGSRRGYVVDGDGRLEYSVPMRFNTVAAAAADLDGDGVAEILFAEGSHTDVSGSIGFHAFRGTDGAPLWSFTTPFDGGEGFFASPAMTDVDGDGALDLLMGSMDHTVYALNGKDGTPIWRSPRIEHYVRHSSPLADLDADGHPEITVHSEAGVVHTYDAGTGAERWSVDLGDIVASTPAVGDLDGDGGFDIVYSLVVEGGVVAVRGDGSLLWRNAAHDFSYRGATLVDVDGDSLPDVVEGDSDDPSLTAYRGVDGSILWDVPIPAAWASGPLVSGDVDGDGDPEILVGSDAGLAALDAATGATRWFLPLPSIRGEPLLADVDGDGNAEILVGAGDGRIYAIGTPEDLRFEPRTIGYWKHQCTVDEPRGDHVGIPQGFADEIRSRSAVFANLTGKGDVCSILEVRHGSMRARAEQQLLALWLNVVSGFVDEGVPIDLPLTAATTVGNAVTDAEGTLRNSSVRSDLERAKSLCDALNNGRR